MGLNIGLPTSTFLPSLGGVEVGLHNIAIRLLKKGHNPIVIAPYSQARVLKKKWNLPYKVISFPPKLFYIFSKWPKLGFLILDLFFLLTKKKNNIDVWHVTVGFPIGVAFSHFSQKMNNEPHLIRCAGEDIQLMPEIGYGVRLDTRIDKLVREWLPKSPCLIAISNSVANEYRKIGVEDSQIKFIPNGVDLSRFKLEVDKKEVKKSLGISESDFVFICVGRNHAKKGFKYLIKAGQLLSLKSSRSFKIIFVGKGVEELKIDLNEKDLELFHFIDNLSSIDKSSLNKNKDNLLMLPSPDLVKLYQSSDCFVFPSLIETFGIVLVEAMASGLPIISTDGDGCRDIIRNGEDGIMVPHSDEVALANSMHKMMNDNLLIEKYKKKSLLRVQNFSWDIIVDSYEKTYYELLRS